MEKRSISGKDILRMDGLLPPTRRVPVCNAVTSTDKRKEKKWSLHGIFKRISMRASDSSSNEEEIVYCTRQPRPRNAFNRKSHNNVVLHPVEKNSDQYSNNDPAEDSIIKPLDGSPLQRDSIHRSSDGSLDGLSKKARKSKLKARIEAKRDRICADSSSDEESRKSCNSLLRYQNENATQSVQKNSSCNRKSRAARTERYIKRMSRDEGHRLPENLNSVRNKRNSLEPQSSVAAENDLLQPQCFINYSNSNTFPVQRSVENLRQSGMAVSNYQARSSTDLAKHYSSQYITDLNQNNTYAKINVPQKNKNRVNYDDHLFSSTISTNYAEPSNCTKARQYINHSSSPPEPPPRDPRFRAFGYGCNSYPFNGKYRATRHDDSLRMKMNDIHEITKDHLKGLRSYDSNNEISWCGSNRQCPRRPLSLTVTPTQSCNLSECTNNRHNSTGKHVDEPAFYETEAMKCQRRNDRNDQLNSRFNDRDTKARRSISCAQNVRKSSLSPTFKITESSRVRSPTNRATTSYELSNEVPKSEPSKSEQETLDKRRSSKNLEEALSELEAIYNSLRLGDEDLLDRAERRSMEEFSLRQAKTTIPFASEDSPDRTKDDMAYRRMHPKERPTSLSEAVGQSALSNISYLIASPVLTRKESIDDFLCNASYPSRRDEPDVTRDDVVYRSIHHANNTLKVIDPQPPFGIPLGPVTTAPESDYLHTTPTKPDHPRSSYIPQCEPDIVTDDLAYRTLRKDANASKNTVESKIQQENAFGTKKKRAVRSLSANLYGLINHDRIHLRREPSLQEIKDQMRDTVIDVGTLPARSNCFRRVVSDGELSDYETRWRTELKGSKTDINGNHSLSIADRKKLRVYVAPSTIVQDYEKVNEKDPGIQVSVASNDFWQDSVKPKSDDSLNKDTDSDFTAYSRLCQDLVNLIEGQNDSDAKAIDQTVNDQPKDSVKIEEKRTNESPVLRIQSLGSLYAKNNEDADQVDKLMEPFTNPENEEDSRKSEDSAFDFYLRVADENVKLIAEAFSSVADHLRDSRLSQKNSLTSGRSEIETDSTAPNTSTRSSVTYSPDNGNDGFSAKTIDPSITVPTEDATIALRDDREEEGNKSNVDPELDLSKAVHDLQIAAESLCKHEKEIEELEALLKKDSSSDASCSDSPIKEEKRELIIEESCSNKSKDKERKEDYETIVKPTELERDVNVEGEGTEYKNACESYDTSGIVRSSETRISYITNLITIMLTTYSMVLLACFLALLLATIAVS